MERLYEIFDLNYNNVYENIKQQYAFLIGFVLASYIFLYYYRKYTYWSGQGIKGPKPIPPFGTVIYDLIYSRDRALRGWTKRYGKVFGVYTGVEPLLVVSDAQIIKDVMVKDAHIFPNHRKVQFASKWNYKMLFFRRDKDWKHLRSLMAFTFTSGKIKKMFNLMRESSDELIHNIHKGIDQNNSIDIKLAYGCFTLDVIARTAFAMKLDNAKSEQKYRKDLVNKLMEDFKQIRIARLVFLMMIPKFILRAIGFQISDMKLQNHLAAISMNIIQSRRKDESHKRQDMLQLLLDLTKSDPRSNDHIDSIEGDIKESHHVSNYDKQELNDAMADFKKNQFDDHSQDKNQIKLDDDDIIGNCILFIIAGYETTSSLLSFATYSLACHPDIQEELYHEVKSAIDNESQDNPNGGGQFEYETVLSMKLLDAVISETLRMFPPAPVMDRQAISDYKIPSLNITIPAGGVIVFPFMSVHYDPTYYPEPHSFKPSRFLPENRHKLTPYTYLPFGAGIRHCLGMRFALAEAKLALARLVCNFKFTPSNGNNARFPPKLAKTFFMIRCDELDVDFSKR